MAETRTETKPEIPIIKGSTADIIATLYVRSMNFKDVSPTDPVIQRCAALDARTMHAKNDLAYQGNIEETVAEVGAKLKKLEENIKTKDKSVGFQPDYNLFKTNAAKLKESSQKLQEQYQKLIHEQREEISELIINPNRTGDDVTRVLTRLEKNLEQFNNSVTQFTREQSTLEKNLMNLNGRVTEAMPIKMQTIPSTPLKPD